jgi:hypothetical protein
LGVSSRLLVGLGTQPVATILSQGLKPDIFDQYLVGAGNGDWTTWNSPAGAYVGVVASQAEQVGAIPMYTLYQMATNGDGNLADLNDTTFMTRYWSVSPPSSTWNRISGAMRSSSRIRIQAR